MYNRASIGIAKTFSAVFVLIATSISNPTNRLSGCVSNEIMDFTAVNVPVWLVVVEATGSMCETVPLNDSSPVVRTTVCPFSTRGASDLLKFIVRVEFSKLVYVVSLPTIFFT